MLRGPFSFGRRKCVGFRIATLELKIQIAKIFYKYKVELEPKNQKFIMKQELFYTANPYPKMKVTLR